MYILYKIEVTFHYDTLLTYNLSYMYLQNEPIIILYYYQRNERDSTFSIVRKENKL